jgi:hypothetical protein
MDARQAAENLELIRTLMERTVQYQLLTARAGLAAGCLAALGTLSFLWLDAGDPGQFGAVWGLVFAGSFAITCISTVNRGRATGEQIWSRQARAVLWALLPSLFAAFALTLFFFARGEHLWLPGVWLLCYGQGALATANYAPVQITWLGVGSLVAGLAALILGPAWAVPMMGLSFGLGHITLGTALLLAERRQHGLRIHRSVA